MPYYIKTKTNKIKFILNKQKIYLGCLFVILLIFLGLRFYDLTILPAMNDEAIYLQWANWIKGNWASNKFISLTMDDKPFLHPWFLALGASLFKLPDPVFSGRFNQALFSILGLLGFFWLINLLGWSRPMKIFGLLLYSINPFILFYDRLALSDGTLSILSIYFIVFFLLLFKEKDKAIFQFSLRRLGIILTLGGLMALMQLIKTSALLIFILPPFYLLLAFFGRRFKAAPFKKTIFDYGLSCLLALAIYFIIIPADYYFALGSKHNQFILTLNQILKLPYLAWWSNFKLIFLVLFTYLTPFVFLLSFLGFFKKKFAGLTPGWIKFYCLAPLVIIVFIAFNPAPRYFLFVTPCFIVLATSSMVFLIDYFKKSFRGQLIKNILIALCLALLIFPSFYDSILLITQPPNFPWLKQDRITFINGWSSGYGLVGALDYLKTKSQSGQLIFTKISLGYPIYLFLLYANSFPYLRVADINLTDIESRLEAAGRTESVKPILLLLDSGRSIFYDSLEQSQFCRNKEVFYRPDNINYVTLCFVN